MVVREKGKARVSDKELESGLKYEQGERDAGATKKRGQVFECSFIQSVPVNKIWKQKQACFISTLFSVFPFRIVRKPCFQRETLYFLFLRSEASWNQWLWQQVKIKGTEKEHNNLIYLLFNYANEHCIRLVGPHNQLQMVVTGSIFFTFCCSLTWPPHREWVCWKLCPYLMLACEGNSFFFRTKPY